MVVVMDVMTVVVTVDCVFGNTDKKSSRNIVRLRGITSALLYMSDLQVRVRIVQEIRVVPGWLS